MRKRKEPNSKSKLESQHQSSKKRKKENETQLVMCQFCPRSFSALRWNTAHCMKNHLELVKSHWIPCDKCDSYFPAASQLTNHKNQVHRDSNLPSFKDPVAPCKFCGKSITSKCLMRHMKSVHREEIEKLGFKCKTCGKYFMRNDTLLIHMNRDHGEPRPQPKRKNDKYCRICKTSFKEGTLKFHIKKNHKEDYFQCQQCGCYYTSKFNLEAHEKRMHNTDVVCEFCSEVFINMKFLVQHSSIKHKKELESQGAPHCESCSLYFFSEEDFMTHQNEVHSRYKCDFCPASFKQEHFFLKHNREEHSKNITGNWLSCIVCNLNFPNKEVLSAHKCSICLRVLCKFCPHVSKTITLDTVHRSEEHPETIPEDWIKCGWCKTFLPKEMLVRHKQSLHRYSKLWIIVKLFCDDCEIHFKTKTDYILHMNEKHFDDVAAVWKECKHCSTYFPPRRFSHPCVIFHNHYRRILKRFGKVSGVRFQCDVCSDTVHALHYIAHLDKYHLDEVKKNWIQCSSCKDHLPNRGLLNLHRKFIHSENFFHICMICGEYQNDLKDLGRHLKDQHGHDEFQKWWGCQKCSRVFFTLRTYDNHMKSKHLKKAHMHSRKRTKKSVKTRQMKATKEVRSKEDEIVMSNHSEIAETSLESQVTEAATRSEDIRSEEDEIMMSNHSEIAETSPESQMTEAAICIEDIISIKDEFMQNNHLDIAETSLESQVNETSVCIKDIRSKEDEFVLSNHIEITTTSQGAENFNNEGNSSIDVETIFSPKQVVHSNGPTISDEAQRLLNLLQPGFPCRSSSSSSSTEEISIIAEIPSSSKSKHFPVLSDGEVFRGKRRMTKLAIQPDNNRNTTQVVFDRKKSSRLSCFTEDDTGSNYFVHRIEKDEESRKFLGIVSDLSCPTVVTLGDVKLNDDEARKHLKVYRDYLRKKKTK